MSGDGVVVACKDDKRGVGAPLGRKQEHLVSRIRDRERLRDEREQVLANLGLVAAFRGDVYELERTRGEALGERGHSASVQRHNLPVTPRQPDPRSDAEPERGFVLGVFAKGADGEDELVELRELARTAGVLPVAELVQHRLRPDPRTFVGKGKLEELKFDYAASDAEVLLVDEELSPTQQRTLENTLESRVVDRTQLILDIFAQHAVTAEGKLQVELAQLEYNLPRMRGMWQHLERLGGGVGTRGPGESQLETDRRLARTRVSLVKRRLRGLGDQRAVRRKERQRSAAPTIALAGYTNVGKSTLLNALTGAKATVDDRLFETLDPMTRAFEHQGKRYLLTDTVGFIRRLPTQLVEGFAATLEDTLVADLVLHVADGSLQESRLRETIAAVQSVLHDIGADDVPVELVFNKVDVLDPIARGRLESGFPRALQVSAATGEGLDELRDRIAELFSDRFEDVRLLVPYQDGSALAELYDLGTPIAERRDTAEGVRVRARLPRREIPRFARFLVAGEPEAEAAGP
ncbi:GTPase HflX [soil metagenome]